jgi:hypothetical protein
MSGRSQCMATAFEWSIPGGMILLVVVGIYELWREKQRKRTGKRLSASYVDEYTAIFYGTKRMELNHRDSVEMLREEDAQGAPPRLGVDLDRGVVVLRPDDPGSGPAARR